VRLLPAATCPGYGSRRWLAPKSGGDSPAREQLSALRSLLVLAMLLTQQDSQATTLNMVANAVESLGRCQLKGIYFDGRRQGVPVHGPGAAAVSPPPAELVTAGLPPDGQVELAGLPWGWAYPLAGTRRGGGRGCWEEAGEGDQGPFRLIGLCGRSGPAGRSGRPGSRPWRPPRR
jgi:hypothetical protein